MKWRNNHRFTEAEFISAYASFYDITEVCKALERNDKQPSHDTIKRLALKLKLDRADSLIRYAEYKIGYKFNSWTIISDIYRNKHNEHSVDCKCSCGNVLNVKLNRIINKRLGKQCKNCYVSSKKTSEEERRLYKHNWFKNNPIKAKEAKERNWNSKPEEYKFIKSRHYNLKYNYGLTLDQYTKILIEQDYKCKICGIIHSEEKKHRRLFVDHNHDTDRVRGLLCHTCNVGLGSAYENIEILNNAIYYLENNAYITNYREKSNVLKYGKIVKYKLKSIYATLLHRQNNKCAICKEEFKHLDKHAIDHDHVTGNIRGLLCGTCNKLLGCARDNKDTIRNMIKYLEVNQ